VIGVLLVEQPLPGEHHVVGVEGTRGVEPGRVVKGDALAQGQGIEEAVFAGGPAGGEPSLQRQGVGVHLQQTVVERA